MQLANRNKTEANFCKNIKKSENVRMCLDVIHLLHINLKAQQRGL